MTIVALLPPRLLRHLQFVVGREQSTRVAQSWENVEEIIRTMPVTVAVVDPTAGSEGTGTKKIAELLADYPSVPIVAYVTVSPLALRAVADLSRAGLRQVMLYSFDDSPARMLAILDEVRASPLTKRVVAALQPSFAKLPVSLRRTIEDVFAEPHRYTSAPQVAAGAGIPLARLYRSVRAAGLTSPKKLLTSAKLLRAYGFLADPGQSVRSVAKKLGYSNSRILVDHTFEVFGYTPSHVRDHMTEDQVVERLVTWITSEDAKGELPTEATAGTG